VYWSAVNRWGAYTVSAGTRNCLETCVLLDELFRQILK